MLDIFSEQTLTALVGVFGGVLLGLAARLGRFCTLGAIEDLTYAQDNGRARMWALVIGLSIMGTFASVGLGWLDLSQSLYHQVPWSPAYSIIGGLLFGYGMALAGNCGFGALARLGGGDFRAFVIVLVMGVTAYMALSGPFASLRVSGLEATSVSFATKDFATGIASIIPLPVSLIGLLLGGAITIYALASNSFRSKPEMVFWGAAASLAIVSGWVGTYWVSSNGFEAVPVLSHTYTAPVGETLLFLMTASGGGMSFGVGSVTGVLLGAFVGSLKKGHFRWEACEDPRELRRQIMGGVSMGFGAVLAVGCTVGQGMSAFSVLSYSAPITLLCIVVGARIGLRQLIHGFSPVV